MNSFHIPKISKTLLVILLSILLSLVIGCWDRREINDIAIVLSTGIDYINEDEIELSVEIVMPEEMAGHIGEGGRGGDRSTFVESATGVTMADARSKLQQKLSRFLFWGHAENTVIGEKLAEKGIREHLDFFSRMPETRLRNWVFVSEGKAKDLISSLPHLENSAAATFIELSEFQIGMNVTMKDLMQMLKSDTGGAALPIFESLPPKKEKGKLEGRFQPYLSGTAVFKDDKMIGKLNDEVSRGLLWIRDEIHYATVTVDVEEEGATGKVSLELIRSHTELIPKIKNNKWSMILKIYAEDDVIQNASHLDLRNPDFIKMIETKMEEAIEERIKLVVEQVQKQMKVDIFNFNESFQRHYTKEWQTAKKNWDEIFPEIEIEYIIEAAVLRPGTSTTPSAVPERELKDE
ncbi:hypothetical protein BKP35_05385 [Anaerobacillus arseniciselenatis]|uniref:Uncharacterized protein n=1 Tax=Anaerobacillus arseniciselenatis TaxID=85682 RepID=A0A1S2LRY9_9BACI|nr:Ger(x)C family spore germination protein [Anaerobacillus arseniciselenatis]OIJ15281.1 hypothetical protein BKP35_05385 [Anaerobacillus arseniciselenatis]